MSNLRTILAQEGLIKEAAPWDFAYYIGETDERKGRTSVSLRATGKMGNMPADEVNSIAELLEDLGPVIARDHGQPGRLSGGPSVAGVMGKVTVSAGIFIDAGSTTAQPGGWHKGWKLA
jgi:hypothetical protein